MKKNTFLVLTFFSFLLCADSVKYIAHRGDYVDAPEGTAAAYRFAVERHYDIMKMDVQKTKDGVIVMSHDDNLKRTMGWDVKIKDVTYDEIKRHGPFKPVGEFKDERIVTFKEAIAIAKALPEIWIDTKHFDPEFFEEMLKQAAAEGVTEERIMVATFSKAAIQYVQKNHPAIRRVLHTSISKDKERNVLKVSFSKNECATMDDVVAEIIAAKAKYGLFGVNIPADGGYITEEIIKKLHFILKHDTKDSTLEWFAVGDYKKRPNVVGGRETTKPKSVPSRMKSLLDSYNAKQLVTINDIIAFHAEFEQIHPFQDGNGRVGRLIALKECLRHNIIPFLIEDSKKAFYYRGLSQWNNERGWLIDTCLDGQDTFRRLLAMFE